MFLGDVLGKPYERQILQLLRVSFLFLIFCFLLFSPPLLSLQAGTGSNTLEDTSSFFCSELIAAAYKELGLLSDEKLSNNYIPGDFGRNFPLLRKLVFFFFFFSFFFL